MLVNTEDPGMLVKFSVDSSWEGILCLQTVTYVTYI
jgi:hypothetical protein